MIFITVIISVIGFIDDYLKIKKKDKVGLKGKFKILGQILIGIIVSYVVVTNDSVVVRDFLDSVTQDGSKDQYVDSRLAVCGKVGQRENCHKGTPGNEPDCRC